MNAPYNGEWYNDTWLSDSICPEPEHYKYRDAVEFDPEPIRIISVVDELHALCSIKCGGYEAGDDHPVEKRIEKEEGWSVSGSIGLNIERLFKIFKLQGTYSKKRKVNYVIKHKFPHCDKDGVLRRWTVDVLKVETTYIGKVWRYYKNAKGEIRRNSDGTFYRTYQGWVELTYTSYMLGINRFEDLPCKEGLDIYTPKYARKTIIGKVKNVLQIRELTEQSQEYALKDLSKRLKLKNHDKVALKAILDNDNNKIEQIIEEIGVNYENVTEDMKTLAWLISNRDSFESLSDKERKLIKKIFNL